jgi:hypothetical protein
MDNYKNSATENEFKVEYSPMTPLQKRISENIQLALQSIYQSGMDSKMEKILYFFENIKEELQKVEQRLYPESLCYISIEQAKIGMFDEAHQTLREIREYSWKAKSSTDIAIEYINLGLTKKGKEQFIEARIMAQKIKDDNWRDEVLCYITTMQARAKMIDQARETLSMIEDQFSYAAALRNIGVEEVKFYLYNEAKKTFVEAKETIQKIEDHTHRATAFLYLATEEARIGLIDEAKEVFIEVYASIAKIKFIDIRYNLLEEAHQAEIDYCIKNT